MAFIGNSQEWAKFSLNSVLQRSTRGWVQGTHDAAAVGPTFRWRQNTLTGPGRSPLMITDLLLLYSGQCRCGSSWQNQWPLTELKLLLRAPRTKVRYRLRDPYIMIAIDQFYGNSDQVLCYFVVCRKGEVHRRPEKLNNVASWAKHDKKKGNISK